MSKIGIFFGTDSGTTRLIAKKMAKKLGADVSAKPLNINRVSVDDIMQFDALIFGTPTYGEGVMPGIDTGVQQGSWQEFAPQLADIDMRGKVVALYGLGNQEKYPDHFVDGLYQLYALFKSTGASLIGEWDTEGYRFEQSKAVVEGRFVGLVIDNHSQGLLTEERLDAWVEQIRPQMLKAMSEAA